MYFSIKPCRPTSSSKLSLTSTLLWPGVRGSDRFQITLQIACLKWSDDTPRGEEKAAGVSLIFA